MKTLTLKIVIILLSFTLVGVKSVPASVDPGAPAAVWDPTAGGFVEVIVFGEVSVPDAAFTMNPAQVTMWFTGMDPSGGMVFKGQAYTTAQGTYGRSPITGQAWWPVRWDIHGSMKPSPDCSIEMTIDEIWYPGMAVTCGPFIGCIAETWPSAKHFGTPIYIPWDKATGTTVTGGTHLGFPIHLTAVIYHVVAGGGSSDPSGLSPLGCEFHVMFPVIPQAEGQTPPGQQD
jgi:hypothetical protein